MPEYIEREAAKDELLSWAVCINYPEHLMREDAMHVLDSIPAADVAPVRHGRWLPTTKWWQGGSAWKQCSECGRLHCGTPNYCNNCGAIMDGGNDD